MSLVDIRGGGSGIFSGTSALLLGRALTAAGLMHLGGAFLSSSCGLSFTDELLSLLLANALLLPKTSLHLGATLTLYSSFRT